MQAEVTVPYASSVRYSGGCVVCASVRGLQSPTVGFLEDKRRVGQAALWRLIRRQCCFNTMRNAVDEKRATLARVKEEKRGKRKQKLVSSLDWKAGMVVYVESREPLRAMMMGAGAEKGKGKVGWWVVGGGWGQASLRARARGRRTWAAGLPSGRGR